MRKLKTAPFLLLLLLAGCAQVKPSWNGFYLGAQQVGEFDRRPDFNGSGVYGNAIWNLGKKNSFQLEIIEPMRGGEPLYRVAVDRKLW